MELPEPEELPSDPEELPCDSDEEPELDPLELEDELLDDEVEDSDDEEEDDDDEDDEESPPVPELTLLHFLSFDSLGSIQVSFSNSKTVPDSHSNLIFS